MVSKSHKLVGIALLAGIGFILMFLSVPLIFPFLKLDLSDITVLLGGLLYGPLGGIGVAFVRSLLHFLMTGAGLINLVGDTAAFIASVGFMLPIVWGETHKVKAPLSLAAGTISLTLVMSILNLVLIMPMYMAVMNFQLGMSTLRYVLIGVVPFNLIKGVVVSTVFFVIARAILPRLMRQVKRA